MTTIAVPEELWSRVLRALGVGEDLDEAPVSQIEAYTRGCRALLIECAEIGTEPALPLDEAIAVLGAGARHAWLETTIIEAQGDLRHYVAAHDGCACSVCIYVRGRTGAREVTT